MRAKTAVTNMTNDLLKKNSEMLHTSTVEVAKGMERGIVDIETLKQTNETLIKTFDEVLQIQAEGRQKRAEAEVEMRRIEAELKQKMLEIPQLPLSRPHFTTSRATRLCRTRRYEQDMKTLRAPAACESVIRPTMGVSSTRSGGHATSMERGSLMLNATTFVGLDVHARIDKGRRPRCDDRRGPLGHLRLRRGRSRSGCGPWTLPPNASTSRASPGSTCRRGWPRWGSTASSARCPR